MIQIFKSIATNITQLIEALVEFDYDEALKEMEKNKLDMKQDFSNYNDDK